MAFLYVLWQWTWGLPQSLVGGLVYMALLRRTLRDPGGRGYRGAVVTPWPFRSGVSLGMFIFLPEGSDDRLLRHEYGHTIQSLVLGPLYLLIIGLPSLVWAGLPALDRRRYRKHISYYDFYTERWADRWGGVDRQSL